MILDCGRHETGRSEKDDADWWLELYVLLSRATRSEDLLVMRGPRFEFFQQGPPPSLAEQLEQFSVRTEECRREARILAGKLGFSEFLRQH